MAQATGENPGSRVQKKSGGTDDMISELLLAGGNLAKVRLKNPGTTAGEAAEMAGQSAEEPAAADQNSEAPEALQAWMVGLAGTVPVSNAETAIPAIQTAQSEASLIAGTIGATAGDSKVRGNQRNIAFPMTAEHSRDGSEATAGGTAAVQAGNTEEVTIQQVGNVFRTDTVSSGSSGKTSGEGEIDFLHAAGIPPMNDEKQGTALREEFVISDAETSGKTIDGKDQNLSAIADSVDKPKQETEADGIDPKGLGLRDSVQGAASAAVAASETAEPNRINQPAETNDLYIQIRDEILTKLEQQGPTEFKMQLEPEDLGQIDIKLKLSEGKLIIDILATNSKTQALLANQVDRLISGMGLQNVQVENVQVSQPMNSQTQDNGQNQGFTMNSAMDFSQRKQQEQYQQQFAGSAQLNGAFILQQEEQQTGGTVNLVGSNRYDSHRMNYAV